MIDRFWRSGSGVRSRASVSRVASVFLVLALWSTAILVVLATGIRSTAAPSPEIRLRVMTFNIFYGGDEIDLTSNNWCLRPAGCQETFEKVLDTIRAANADVIGLQEAVMNTRRIADRLGWYHSERMQIVSRFPLIDPPGGDGLYILVEPSPGRVAALANVHLPAEPYGPYEVQAGASAEQVIALEEAVRLPPLRRHLEVLPRLAAQGIPVFLTGDFNSPSHLDWTAAVADARADVPYPLEWPVGRVLAAAGFEDSYRIVHPDPLGRPGLTWTPGSLEAIPNEVHDRIDWVLAGGPATAIASTLVGEVGNPEVAVAMDPYPTDHRGVVSTFLVDPGEMPTLVAVDTRRLEAGEPLTVRFHSDGRLAERVAIVPAGASASVAVASQSTGRAMDGTLRFSTMVLRPRPYEALLVARDGRELARIPFWLYESGAPTTVTTAKKVYERGEPIVVYWANAPGMKWDWVGLYEAGDNDGSPISTTCFTGYCGNGHYLMYEYTSGTIEGSTAFTEMSPPGSGMWPLRPGIYEFRLLLDDGYRSVASSAQFKVLQR